MPNWEGSTRRKRLPREWDAIRRKILERDGHRCTHTEYGIRCGASANQVDHIRRGDDHRESNLTSLCESHHAAKSSSEGAEANNARRRDIRQRYRRTERHPGLT